MSFLINLARRGAGLNAAEVLGPRGQTNATSYTGVDALPAPGRRESNLTYPVAPDATGHVAFDGSTNGRRQITKGPDAEPAERAAGPQWPVTNAPASGPVSTEPGMDPTGDIELAAAPHVADHNRISRLAESKLPASTASPQPAVVYSGKVNATSNPDSDVAAGGLEQDNDAAANPHPDGFKPGQTLSDPSPKPRGLDNRGIGESPATSTFVEPKYRPRMAQPDTAFRTVDDVAQGIEQSYEMQEPTRFSRMQPRLDARHTYGAKTGEAITSTQTPKQRIEAVNQANAMQGRPSPPRTTRENREPDIQVRIGKVEVRSPQPTPPPSRPARPRGFDDYLDLRYYRYTER